ncbi:putative multidrug resistance protein EmrY [Planctomycetes bacterium Pan216]|uniref:Putative multidrug resistance protein EmrY n=1 Tax=Kolteria novifilia TaxID=2527975 RepID=A0A518B8V8_9BACT|nr:putative multidrug resistance protein EmrY [Planctomycetes bacterium Pan216]
MLNSATRRLDALFGRGQGAAWATLAIVSLEGAMELWDINATNVAVRHIAGGLSASPSEALWILTTYLVATAIAMPLTGWLSGVFGRKWFFIYSVSLFTLGAFLAGTAPSLELLLVYRFFQGLGGGAMTPVGESLLYHSYPAKQRGTPMAIYASSYVLGLVLGALGGGMLADIGDWRLIYLINVPTGLTIVALTLLVVKDSPSERAERERCRREFPRLNHAAFLLIAVGMACLQITFDRGQLLDWFHSPTIVWLAAVSVVTLGVGIAWELRHPRPVLDFRLLLDRNFAIGCVLIGFIYAIAYGSLTLLPAMLDDVIHYPSTNIGWLVAMAGLLVLPFPPLAGWLKDRGVRHEFLLFGGTTLLISGLWWLSRAYGDVSPLFFILPRAIQQLGVMVMLGVLFATPFQTLPAHSLGNASAFFNLIRMVAASLGVSLVGIFLVRRTVFHRERLVGNIDQADAEVQEVHRHLADRAREAGATLDQASMQANDLIDAALESQATQFAFMEAFRVMAFAAMLLIPLILLQQVWPVKKPRDPESTRSAE